MKSALCLTCILVFLLASSVDAASYFHTTLTKCNVSTPEIVFKEGINGTAYTISTNNTWAEVNITGTSETAYYEYMLNITNLSSGIDFQVRQEVVAVDDVSRLENFTTYFNNGTATKQVEISNGLITQSMGSWYSMSKLATICLSLAIRINMPGSSTLNLKVHIIGNEATTPEIIQTITINVS